MLFFFYISHFIPGKIDRLPSVFRFHLSTFVRLEEVRVGKGRDQGIPEYTFHFLFPISDKPQVCPVQQRIVYFVHCLHSTFELAAKPAFEAIDTP